MDFFEINLEFEPENENDQELLNKWDKETDIVILSGDIETRIDKPLIHIIEDKCHGSKILFYLTTPGGDADAAYKLSRYFQYRYDHFTLAVMGECKSAGTLLALGASEVVMSQQGEFGPLDVQLFRPDEFLQRTSGLTISQALSFISDKAFDTFENIFLALRGRSGGVITTTTAADIASSIVTGIYAPITEKIDPMRIGEMQRYMDIALHYGIRLGAKEEIVRHLTTNFPSHSFVIDFDEAQGLFNNVRLPTETEKIITFHILDILKNECNYNPFSLPIEKTSFNIVNIKERLISESKEEEDNEGALSNNNEQVENTKGNNDAKGAKEEAKDKKPMQNQLQDK